MVIVKLKGGLGNQLFQFAFGRAIANHLRWDLFFDLSYFTINSYLLTPREFKLTHLSNWKIFGQELTSKIGQLEMQKDTFLITDDLPDYSIIGTINNREIRNIILDGYFQAEFYLLYFKKQIRKEVQLLLASYLNIESLAEIIPEKCESVCIHVRRGDYLSPRALKVHGICGKSYYQEAIAIIKIKLNNPRFYIFSDDPISTNDLLFDLVDESTNVSSIINEQFSEHQDLIELSLMTHCKHFIIANSSFSWWGSYLSDSTSKIVIAPQKWYQDESLSELSDRIGLKSWIRI